MKEWKKNEKQSCKRICTKSKLDNKFNSQRFVPTIDGSLEVDKNNAHSELDLM